MTLTFEEFTEKASNLPDVSVDKNDKIKVYGYGSKKSSWGKPAVSVSWYTGGYWNTGDEDNHYATTGEPEPDFSNFENLVLHFCPNITFLEFRNIRGLIKQNNWTEDEDYGNYTNHSEKYAYLEDIYNWLVQKGYPVLWRNS